MKNVFLKIKETAITVFNKALKTVLPFFSKKTNIILSCIIFLLLIALVFTSVFAAAKSDAVVTANASYSSEKEKLNNTKDKLNKANKEKDNLKSQLEAKEIEKDQLEDTINNLKSEIANLRAMKEANIPIKRPVVLVQPATSIDSKVCYLTFDDGPSENTRAVLDILARYHIKATFFVTNDGSDDIIGRIYNEGHTIGLHTATHNYAQIYSSTDAYFNDLQMVSDRVERITGQKVNLLRFPGGSSNMVSQITPGIMTDLVGQVSQKGYSYFDWNVDSSDASGSNRRPDVIIRTILKGAANKNTICVLMHDSSAKVTTVQALSGIIEGLAAQGFTFGRLSTDSPTFHHNIKN